MSGIRGISPHWTGKCGETPHRSMKCGKMPHFYGKDGISPHPDLDEVDLPLNPVRENMFRLSVRRAGQKNTGRWAG